MILLFVNMALRNKQLIRNKAAGIKRLKRYAGRFFSGLIYKIKYYRCIYTRYHSRCWLQWELKTI